MKKSSSCNRAYDVASFAQTPNLAPAPPLDRVGNPVKCLPIGKTEKGSSRSWTPAHCAPKCVQGSQRSAVSWKFSGCSISASIASENSGARIPAAP